MITKLGANETQVNNNGYLILYSYNTPVAVRQIASGKEWRTNKKWSVTTSKHLNKWCSPDAKLVEQSVIDSIVTNGYSSVIDSLLLVLV